MTPMEQSVRTDGRAVIVRHSATGEDNAPFEAPANAGTTGASVPVLFMWWHSLRRSPGSLGVANACRIPATRVNCEPV